LLNRRFMKALKAQGISRSSLPYQAPFQPYGSWFALIATAIITFFKGFDTFIPWNTTTFITSYIAIPVFIVLYLGYKFWFRTRQIDSDKVDLVCQLYIDDINKELTPALYRSLVSMLSTPKKLNISRLRRHLAHAPRCNA
jgi:yeast amino acid transporter